MEKKDFVRVSPVWCFKDRLTRLINEFEFGLRQLLSGSTEPPADQYLIIMHHYHYNASLIRKRTYSYIYFS